MSDLQPPQLAIDAWRDAWNIWIETHVREDNPDNVRRGETALRLLKSLNVSNPSILDVGCANGWFSVQLARFGKVTGVDLADRAIAEAKARYPYVNFICGDFLTLEPLGGEFEVCVSIDVIAYVYDQRSFLDRVARVLAPCGYLILICPNKFVWDRTRFAGDMRGRAPFRWLYMRELKDLLRNDFVLLRSETIIPGGNMGITRIVNSWKVNKAAVKMIGADHVIRLKEKIGLGKSLVVLAQKRN